LSLFLICLFVEPVPYLFDRLKRNYAGHPRFLFENSVVNDGSNITFYWVAEQAKESIPGLPDWYDQLGGFDRAHITRHIPELEGHIQEADLSGITLDHLFAKHDIAKIDLLHIDTEGADFKVLSQLDLNKHTPKIILYERKHLSKKEEDASILFLKECYVLYNLGADILAIERGTNKAMKSILNPLGEFKLADLDVR
jgi:FkbM family methyltransferase